MPYEQLKDVFEKEEQGVFLPYKEFQRLWRAAQDKPAAVEAKPPAAEPAPPPPDPVVEMPAPKIEAPKSAPEEAPPAADAEPVATAQAESIEIDADAFELSGSRRHPRSSLLELNAWIARLAEQVTVDDGFRRLPPALAPANVSTGAAAVASAASRSKSAGNQFIEGGGEGVESI